MLRGRWLANRNPFCRLAYLGNSYWNDCMAITLRPFLLLCPRIYTPRVTRGQILGATMKCCMPNVLGLAVFLFAFAFIGLSASSASADQYSVDFPKKWERAGTCMQQEQINGGNFLHCHIEIPAGAFPGQYIRQVTFTCEPANSGPCQHTIECGHSGTCGYHANPVEPVGFNGQNLTAVDWWGWTVDGNDATLHFDVVVGP